MMNRRRLGSKDIHLDANSLRPLWLADAGGGGTVFVQPASGYDEDAGAFVDRNDGTYLFRITGVQDISVHGVGRAPKANPSCSVIINHNSDENGYIYCNLSLTYYIIGGILTTTATGFTQVAMVASFPDQSNVKIMTTTLTGASAGDLVRFFFRRDANHASDTNNDRIDVLGFLME